MHIFLLSSIDRYPPFTDHTPFGIYDKILSGKIDFPSTLDSITVDLLRGLLKVDKSHRLGNLVYVLANSSFVI
jgi:hypothetical protein